MVLALVDLAENGPTIPIDVPPAFVDGEVLLPIRFIAYALGAEISWNQELREVTLTYIDKTITFPIGG